MKRIYKMICKEVRLQMKNGKDVISAHSLFALLSLVLFSASALSQTPFTYPIKPGDKSVYRFTDMYSDSTVRQSWVFMKKCISATEYMADTVEIIHKPGIGGYFPGLNEYLYGRYMHATISKDGLFEFTSSSTGPNWQKLFPVSPPSADTLVFARTPGDTIVCFVTARFDTTIFNKTVHAFTIRFPEKYNERELTIADTFGLVYARSLVRDRNSKIELINADIDGIAYNPETRSFDFMPICSGDVRHYHYIRVSTNAPWENKEGSYSHTLFKDTLIRGSMYYRIRDPLVSQQVVRDSADGVHIASLPGMSSEFFLPANATLGSEVGDFLVTDTSTVTIWGSARRKLGLTIEIIDNGMYQEWVEGLGLYYIKNFSYFGGTQTDSLLYARLCGKEYGSPLGIPENTMSPVASSLSCEVFPNPMSAGSAANIRFSTPHAHVSALLYDVFGRQVTDVLEKSAGEGTHELLLRAPLLPGTYFLRVSSDKAMLTKMIVVLR